MNDELRDYNERHIRWQNTTIQHMGFTNNLIITLSIGLIAVLINKDLLSSMSLSSDSNFSWNLTLHLFTLLSLLLSTFSGIVNTLSRLYDFRITRNVALAKYRASKKDIKLQYFSFSETNLIEQLGVLISVVSKNSLGLLTHDDTKLLPNDNKLIFRFNDLRKTAFVLGELTWSSIKSQILFLLAAIVFFSISIFTF